MFVGRNKKIMYTLVLLYKMGFKGVNIIYLCFRDELYCSLSSSVFKTKHAGKNQ